MRRAWDRGAAGIERYRLEQGISDKDSALGKEPQGIERARWSEQRSRLVEQQRAVGLAQGRSASQETGHDLGIGM